MKAITLHQPWASLVADGRKRFETRSWAPYPPLIGRRIAIHAARHVDKDAVQDFYGSSFSSLGDVPNDCFDVVRVRGHVLCTAVLRGAYRVAYLDHQDFVGEKWGWKQGSGIVAGSPLPGDDTPGWPGCKTDRYGNFGVGRWLWWLDDVQPLEGGPVPARGFQKVWEWKQDG